MIDHALLNEHLEAINYSGSLQPHDPAGVDAQLRSAIDMLVDQAAHHLAVYGSLAPGQENAWVLNGLSGSWQAGTVRGSLSRVGWGQTLGYPGIIWDPNGPVVSVRIFTSSDLPSAWPRIDEFEGSDYRRILVPAMVAEDVVVANIYEITHAR